MKLPARPIVDYFDKLDFLQKLQIDGGLEATKRFFSKGSLRVYRGEGLSSFSNLSVKGLSFYHYDFGIAYPRVGVVFPLFMYQVIIAADRVLALVHFPFNMPEEAMSMAGIGELLEKETEYIDMLLTGFKPQEFIKNQVIPNTFNGLVRTTAVEEAYKAIADLFKSWYMALAENIDNENTKEEREQFDNWVRDFKEAFYREDYGFKATQRYLGRDWAIKVFEEYLFKLR